MAAGPPWTAATCTPTGGRRTRSAGRQRTPALVRFAVHATRTAKRHEAPETLHDRWRTEALTRGIDPDRLVRQVSGRARGQDQGVSNLAVKRAFNRLAGP